MPKFYASCGSQNLVVAADTAEQAAMRLIDELLAAHVWIYEDALLRDQDRRDHLILEALMHLDTTVSVSERGNGHYEAGLFGVPELLDHWHRLMSAVSKALSSAGLPNDRALPDANDVSQQPPEPR